VYRRELSSRRSMWVHSTLRETSSAGRNDLLSEVKIDLANADRLGLISEMSKFKIDFANADRLGISSEMSEFKIDIANADRLGLSSETLKDKKWLNWLFS
jgi:hypothetical protein